ncbi:response regulator [Methanosalsum natronophilum]|uniref:Response regulator n=1 Tax=Methanosalsum natronophilum TaxID=768733 RepID=A0A3R7VTX3_9EURY|nr:response regulator [Methanosalsum natronophilum]MCS3924811.1 PAS domain S-box-containing protein [Methanosalsum natronophilum]RQD87972.1 MAG: response regulator [Methanosalsum natronophilum]
MDETKILIVEDEIIVAHDLKECVEALGYTVVNIASTGEEAIDITKAQDVDVVLMDISLKGEMDGIESGYVISNQYDIPIIYVTGYSDDLTLERAKYTKPFGYLLKPFEENELKSNIEITIYRHKIAQAKKKRNEDALISILNNIEDAIVATDINGTVKHLNTYAESLTGWKKEDAIGKNINTILKIKNILGQQIQDPVEKLVKEEAFSSLGRNNVMVSSEGFEIPVDLMGFRVSNYFDECNGLFFNIQETPSNVNIIG